MIANTEEGARKTAPPLMYAVRSFYRFTPLTDNEARKARLLSACRQLDLLGTVLLAQEGINGALFGTESALDKIFNLLAADVESGQMDYRQTSVKSDLLPFRHLRVSIKPTILGGFTFTSNVSAGAPEQIPPEDWDNLTLRPDVLVVDVRNSYETRIGAFAGALLADTDNFCGFPEYARRDLDPRATPHLAICCTGGIRCEKAGRWLKERGFPSVCQLQGGILNYLQRQPEATSRWQGDCFVFDQRIAVNRALEPVAYEICSHCQVPVHANQHHECSQTLCA